MDLDRHVGSRHVHIKEGGVVRTVLIQFVVAGCNPASKRFYNHITYIYIYLRTPKYAKFLLFHKELPFQPAGDNYCWRALFDVFKILEDFGSGMVLEEHPIRSLQQN